MLGYNYDLLFTEFVEGAPVVIWYSEPFTVTGTDIKVDSTHIEILLMGRSSTSWYLHIQLYTKTIIMISIQSVCQSVQRSQHSHHVYAIRDDQCRVFLTSISKHYSDTWCGPYADLLVGFISSRGVLSNRDA